MTVQHLGAPAIYYDIVVSKGLSRTHSPADHAYREKLMARQRYLHPRNPMSAHEAHNRAPSSAIDYVPIAFSTLGAPASRSVSALYKLLGRDDAKAFILAAARAIHFHQARVVATSRYAHSEGTRACPSYDLNADPPTTPPSGLNHDGSPPPAPAGDAHHPVVHASPYFVPLIHAAHAASLTGSQAPPPAAVAEFIAQTSNNYNAWVAEDRRLHSGVADYQPVPSWEETIRAIPAPLAGWPPFHPHYISGDDQERILRLNRGFLPDDIFHVHRWVESRVPIVGWRQFCVRRDILGRRVRPRRAVEVDDG